MFDFDPSRMDPKTLMEISRIVQQLPPEQLSRMQTLMHNMAAGFDVRRDMEEFEKSLPPGFREKLMAAVASSPTAAFSAEPSPATPTPAVPSSPEPSIADETPSTDLDLREARLTILRAVSERQINPEEALLLLFPSQSV